MYPLGRQYLEYAFIEDRYDVQILDEKGNDITEKFIEENKKYYIDAILASGWNATVEAIMKTGFQYLPGTLGYPYSKLVMNYYTAYLQKSFASKKIRVNAVLP